MERLNRIITWIVEAKGTPATGRVNIAALSDDELGVLAAALDDLPDECRAVASAMNQSLRERPSNDALFELLVDLDVRIGELLTHWNDLTRLFPALHLTPQYPSGAEEEGAAVPDPAEVRRQPDGSCAPGTERSILTERYV